MPVALVACTLTQESPPTLRVALAIERPGLPAEPLGAPVSIPWNHDRLPEGFAAMDPQAYGEALGEMLFAPSVRERIGAVVASLGKGETPRFQLRIAPEEPTLHGIIWELLPDPLGFEQPLFVSARWRCSRHLGLDGALPVATEPPDRLALRAVVAVANPPGSYLPPIDVEGELRRAAAALNSVPTTVLGGEGRAKATPTNLRATLDQGAQMLYLVCHGGVIDGEPCLWLDPEREQQRYVPYPAAEFAAAIGTLRRPPLLVLLLSCHSGSDTTASSPINALGPRLAQHGIGAVVGMHGQIGAGITAGFPAALIQGLERGDGDLELAMAEARHSLRVQELQGGGSFWWRPTLWSRLPYGQLWCRTLPRADLAGLVATRDFEGLLATTAAAASGWDSPTLQLYRAFGLLAGALPSRLDERGWLQVEAALLAATVAAAPTTTAATAWALLLLGRIERYILRKRTMPAPPLAELRARVSTFAETDRDQRLLDAFPATPEARAAFPRWATVP
jgi:hypothetical protein